MRSVLLFAAVIASLFPYTQIVAIESYVQPYALILALLVSVYSFPYALKHAPVWDNFAMVTFATTGTFLFFLSCLPQPSQQEVKSFLMYVSPLFLYCVGFTFYRTNEFLFRSVVTCSAIIWLSVGMIQRFLSPSFATHLVGVWSEASEVVVASGRGVLSLAPEPTHHGFHLLLLACLLYLLKGRTIYVVSCILASVLLAGSASAVLALLLGATVLFVIRPIRMFPIFVAASIVLSTAFMVVLTHFDDSNIRMRIINLSVAIFENPTSLLEIDYSINSRIGGFLAGLDIIWNDNFFPSGLSNDYWLQRIPTFLGEYPWLFDLSPAGIPSGIVIILYQMGFLGVPFILYFIYRFISSGRSIAGVYLLLVAIIVFLGQFLISTPIFGLILGCAVSVLVNNNEMRFKEALQKSS